MFEAMELTRQQGGLRRLAGQAALALSLVAGSAGAATETGTELISKAALPASTPSGPSSLGDLSADGRFVVFVSPANDVVPGQADKPYQPGDFLSPGSLDVFLRDRATGKTTLVSRSSSSATTGGQIGNGDDNSYNPVISADGRYTAFISGRRNLVSGQTGSGRDIFLYDRVLNTTSLVSHRPGSLQAGSEGRAITGPPVISADGRFVAYRSDGAVVHGAGRVSENIFLYDRMTKANTFVGRGREVGMSADGRFLVYYNSAFQILLYDRVAGTTTLVSHAAGSPLDPGNDSSLSPVISADGSVVVFSSWAANLVAGQTDTVRTNDLFLYDRVSGQTALVSRSASSPVTVANAESWEPSVSADGRWIAFYSTATNLVSGVTDANNDYDVFLYDRISGVVSLVSHANGSPMTAANRRSLFARISADGSRIAFSSPATDLAPLPSGLDGWTSLFFADRNTGMISFVEPMTKVGLPVPTQNFLSIHPQISADGLAIAFGSYSGLVAGDNNTDWDVYLYDEDGPPSGGAPFTPCTLLDTRRAGDGPALRSNVRRVLNVRSTCDAVPSGITKVVIHVTVLQATGKGNLRFYPGNVQNQPAGTLRFQKGATRTGTFTVPLATNGAGTLAILPFVAGNGTVQVVVEVTGYKE